MSLESQSAHFHAFEWLRAEALKGNKHAMAIITRLLNVEKELQEISKLFGAYDCTLARAVQATVEGNKKLREKVIAAETHLKDIAVNLCGVKESEVKPELVYGLVEHLLSQRIDSQQHREITHNESSPG